MSDSTSMAAPGTAPEQTSAPALPSGTSGTELAPLVSQGLAEARGLSGAQKAMLFLVSLDEQVATKVLANMSAEEVATLRKATQSLADVPNEVILDIHREFILRARAGASTSLKGSGAYLRRLAGNALGEGKAAEIWEEPVPEPVLSGNSIAQLETSMLAKLLDKEHPQTVAVVLSQLEAPRAAEVLERLEDTRRADVLRRLNELESVPEQVLEEIDREFAEHLQRLGNERKRDVKGKDAAAGILKRLKTPDTTAILERLGETHPQVASTLKQALFTFEDLLRIDGRGMQQMLKEVPTDQLVLALKTASEELREKIFGNLSSRAAEMLRDDLSTLGAVRVSDVEEAQRSIVEVALNLETEGRITITRDGGGDYV
jgi:flagellar motor switch protein FliG